MKIVIEIDGEKVTSIGTEPSASARPLSMAGSVPPGPPTPDLLKRAKALGAKSAGPASFGIGAALASASQPNEPATPRTASRKSSTRRTARKRAKR